MKTNADKLEENKSRAIANNASNKKSKEAFNLSHPNPPAHVKQLRNYQKLADNSTQVKQLTHLQAIATNSGILPIQRKRVEESGTPPIQRVAGDALSANGQFALDRLDDYLNGNIPIGPVTGAFTAVNLVAENNMNFAAIFNAVQAGHHENSIKNKVTGRRTALINRVAAMKDELAAGVLERRDNAANPHAGHALARHGPDVSDHHLQHRLTTGYAPDGVFSPAPGLSSKFNSYREYLTTRQAAVNEANTALNNTMLRMNYYLTQYFDKHLEFIESPAGPPRGAAQADRIVARNRVGTQAALIGNPNPDKLQVTTANPPLPVAFANPMPAPARAIALNLIQNMVSSRPTYQIVVDHGQAIGTSFLGTGAPVLTRDPLAPPAPPPPAPDPARTGNTYAGAAPAPAPTRTRTTFEIPGGAQPLQGVPNATNWTAIQHFPTTEPVGVSF